MPHYFTLLFFACVVALLGCGPAPEGEATAGEPAPLAPATSTVAPASSPKSFKGMTPDTIPEAEFAYNDSAALPSYALLTGRFDPAKHPDFERVADRYTDGDPYYLHRETYAALRDLHAHAARDGVRLTLISATRNFDRQKAIWEAKWNGKRLLEGKDKANEVYPDPAERARAILRYSSMPGTSRHHWGTDIDLNALTNGYFTAGEGKRVYDWLRENAPGHGFCQPYTPKGDERPTGYEEERWHWSYLPLATQLSDYARLRLRDRDIRGFDGAGVAAQIGVVEGYVLGIHPRCKSN